MVAPDFSQLSNDELLERVRSRMSEQREGEDDAKHAALIGEDDSSTSGLERLAAAGHELAKAKQEGAKKERDHA